MDSGSEITKALRYVDALPGSDPLHWVWPLNEARFLVEVCPAGTGLRTFMPPDVFPDGADLCTVMGKEDSSCAAEGCGACRIVRQESEHPCEFASRLARFLDRLCERGVAYEDRFLSGFAT